MPTNPDNKPPLNRLQRWLLVAVGCVFLVIGWLGIFVPGWPTTGFWLIAAVCFTRSCPILQQWIYRQPRVGPMIESLIEDKVLPRAAKRYAWLCMWSCISGSLFMLYMIGQSWLIMLAVVAAGAVGHWWIYRLKEPQTTLPECVAQSSSSDPA